MGVGQAPWCPCLLRGRERRVSRNMITRGATSGMTFLALIKVASLYSGTLTRAF